MSQNDISCLITKLSNTNISNNGQEIFNMDELFKVLPIITKKKHVVKTHNFKSFTKRYVYWEIKEYSNGSIICNCPSYKYSNIGKCKHITKLKKKS